MTEHTPSPQSVGVPVEPTPEMLNAAVDATAAGSGMSWSNRSPQSLFEVGFRAMLAAAPAPSSLAGGEVEKATVERLARYMSPLCFENRRRSSRNQHAANKAQTHYRKLAKSVLRFPPIRAALSPEAPSREGVEALRTALIKARSELAIQYCYSAGRMGIAGCYPELAEKYGGSAIVQEIDAVLALTPRHEAPATPCKSCNGTGRELGSAFNRCADCEAPAEGAGEVEAIARLMCRQHYGDRGYSTPGILNVVESDWPAWKEKAEEVIEHLRARSSAPEAREGEPAAWCIPGALATMKADGLSGDIMPAADDEFSQPLYTHPAAPSADKLRIALEEAADAVDFFDRVKAASGAERTAVGSDHWNRMEAALRALAALKAEGAA